MEEERYMLTLLEPEILEVLEELMPALLAGEGEDLGVEAEGEDLPRGEVRRGSSGG